MSTTKETVKTRTNGDEVPPHLHGDQWQERQYQGDPEPEKSTGFELGLIDSRTFAAGDYRCEWLARQLLVRNQPAILGGPKKALKTSILVDLAVSLASARRFLGH